MGSILLNFITMTLGIQFQRQTNWWWVKISAFLIGASGILIVWKGPFWTLGLSAVGVVVSFAGFFRSLRFPKESPSLWFSVILALFHTLFIGLALFLYLLFMAPAVDHVLPTLTDPISAVSGRISLLVPKGWKTSSFATDRGMGVVLSPGPNEMFWGLQEIKVTLKEIAPVGPTASVPLQGEPVDFGDQGTAVLNTYTVKKFWLRFHQVTVLGFKGRGTLCSVSATALSPHLPMAKDLCKALFKNLQVPVTIKP